MSSNQQSKISYEFPASFGQERLWVLEHLTPGVPLYMHAVATRLHGDLDTAALITAINAVVARHEALRSHFRIAAGTLEQIVAPELVLTVPIVDLQDVEPSERNAEASALVERLADETLDIDAGPLIKASIVKLSPSEHILVVVIHHIVSDGWSIGVFQHELSDLYAAALEEREPGLEELPVQYGDFATWQRDYLSGELLAREVSHWRDRLADPPALLELPTDRPRPAVQSFDGAAVTFSVPDEVSAALQSIASSHGATLFMVLLAAFDALLSKYTGQTDLLVATPIAGRNRSELEGLIGFFVNTLILRARVDDDPTFDELVAQIREVSLDAYAHQDLPFEKLVEELNPQRDLSHLPLAQVMFVLQNAAGDELELPGIEATPVELAVDMAPYDLTLEMREDDGRLGGSFIYNTDLFDAATADQLVRHFVTLLANVANDPSQRLSRIDVLADDERDLVLHGWYEDRPEFLPGPLVHESFAAIAATSPERIAATFEDQEVGYGELNARANKLAHHLRERGIGPERVVGIMFEKSIEMLVAILGVWKAGGAFVPLDAEVPAERRSLMLEETGARVVLTLEKLRGAAEALRVSGGPVEVLCLDSAGPALARFSDEDPVSELGPRSLAYVIFTSGSTGAPKGVMTEHGGLVNMARFAVEAYEVRPDSRFLQFMSITFDAFLSEISPTLITGATLCLGRRDQLLPGPDLAAFLRDERITNVLLTPSALALVKVEELPELATLIVCGEACPPELVTRWGRGRSFVNAYGPTEITCFCHADHVAPDGTTPPIGRPLANTRSYVLDDNLEPVPLNVRGELYVGTPGLARGYLNRPDLTAERFLPDPFARTPGERIYRTGDVVRCRRDGKLEFFGRSDSQVKIRGFRVEPGEIEAALLEHPGVAETVVVAHDDGDGPKRLVCYFSARSPATTVGELRSFLAKKVPTYMVPATFVPMTKIPHMPSGKIDRKALPKPPSSRPDLTTAYVAPSTPTEEVVARTWSGILGVDNLGAQDKFFDLGGNSLKIVELSESLNESYPGALSVAELFEHTTVRDMAKVIDDRLGSRATASAVAGFEL